MWTCPTCNRQFVRTKQQHSCKHVSIESHFSNKNHAKTLFDHLQTSIKQAIGPYTVLSLPCCIHLSGPYDFLAVLPKKDRIEIRFILHREISSPKRKTSVMVSNTTIKHCIDVQSVQDIDTELLGWLTEAYHLFDNKLHP